MISYTSLIPDTILVTVAIYILSPLVYYKHYLDLVNHSLDHPECAIPYFYYLHLLSSFRCIQRIARR